MEALGIDIKLLLAQIVNFTILLFLLTKFAYKPILDILEERKKKVNQSLLDAEKTTKCLDNAQDEAKKILDNAYKEAKEIIDSAHKEASEEAAAITKKATEASDKIMARAEEESKGLKEKTLLEAKKEITNLVVLALDKIVKDELDQNAKVKLTEKAIAEL